jgi:HD domain
VSAPDGAVRPWDGREPLDEWAVALTRAKVATAVPRRWSHIAGVVELAREIADVAGGRDTADGALLIAAAAAHDIGHAPDLARTGFAALDGVEYLRTVNAPQPLLNLVANYFASGIEGELRGYTAQYAVLPDEVTPVRDALWYADLRVGPDGDRVEIDHRFAELWKRYERDDIAMRWWALAETPLRDAVARTQRRISDLRLTPA